ncbi:centrosomal protein of 131 kDa [Microplitis mediator]|uniref:centrosomal protein of 131 kDa n=1 Tax=Microplitis mediator TaxID=375433 RepID=UPI0025529DAF|nr:centrosomal protein of 131 kDa [Microplitis mediator]
MINILHQKVTSKPPISKKIFKKTPGHNVGSRETRGGKSAKDEEEEKINECTECSDQESRGQDGFVKKNGPSDCNQNIIESDSCSLDQLCSMISDLEQSLDHQVVAVDTCIFPTENPVTFIDLDHMLEKEDCGSCGASSSTYDDIMSFLGTLEQDCPLAELETTLRPISNSGNTPRPGSNAEEPKEINELKSLIKNPSKVVMSDTTKDDLATALLQLEDREATLKLLKEELKNERKAACDKLETRKKEHASELQAQKNKYQNIIRRHQKFVEQLIEEKKQLSDKCNTLATTIKDMEVKHHREIKLAMEKHGIEIQRTRDMCLAGEKIRRERWLEAKTSKIKEITVKGLEPELRNMIDQHQQEIQDIRSAHMKELQEVELRAIRRANQQLEELRLELTASHDKVLASEKEAMRVRYQEKFDEQETLIQNQQRRFFEELQQEKKRFADELARRDAERDATVQQITSQCQEKIDKLVKQFEVDRKTLKENLDAEREAWVDNYKKQQTCKFEMAEARIRDECNRERDRQIELAISRLEKETRDMKQNLVKSSDSKLQCLRDKYEGELEISWENERTVREKFEVTATKLDALEIEFRKTECKLSKCLAELQEASRVEEKLTRERDHAKKLARQEIEIEKRQLEDKVGSLYKEIEQINANRDSNLAQLYSRIKLIITQKDITIKSMRRECDEVKNKCDHLEKLIDQQRKEYVLKAL